VLIDLLFNGILLIASAPNLFGSGRNDWGKNGYHRHGHKAPSSVSSPKAER
jgi:hypothetical protein